MIDGTLPCRPVWDSVSWYCDAAGLYSAAGRHSLISPVPVSSPAPSCKSPHCVRTLLSGAGFTGGGSVTSDDGTRISADGGWPPAGLVLPLLGPRGLAVSALRAGVRVSPPPRPPPSSTPGHLPPLRRGGVGRGRQGRARLTLPHERWLVIAIYIYYIISDLYLHGKLSGSWQGRMVVAVRDLAPGDLVLVDTPALVCRYSVDIYISTYLRIYRWATLPAPGTRRLGTLWCWLARPWPGSRRQHSHDWWPLNVILTAVLITARQLGTGYTPGTSSLLIIIECVSRLLLSVMNLMEADEIKRELILKLGGHLGVRRQQGVWREVTEFIHPWVAAQPGMQGTSLDTVETIVGIIRTNSIRWLSCLLCISTTYTVIIKSIYNQSI